MATRKNNAPAPTPPADELESLREEWSGPDDEPAPGPDAKAADGAAPARPLVTEGDRTEDVAVMVAAWHADPTAVGFVHRGGMCGCRYLARAALDAALPVMASDERDEEGGAGDAPA